MHSQPSPLRKVVVIGAGFAGLGAASTLTSNGTTEVVVLEASEDVGGRARLGQLPSGTPVELGATWFHGIQNNILYDLAVWQGVARDLRGDPDLSKHEIDWQLHFAKPMEKRLLEGRTKEVALEAVYHFTEAAEECIEDESISATSVGALLRQRFDQEVKERGLSGEELSVYASSWWFREKMQRTFDGFWSTDDVSLAFPREFETLDGPNMPVPGGYQALAQLLAKECQLDIRYGHRVKNIEWTLGGSAGGGAGVRVTCTNGAVVEADAVIITVSIGILQERHHELFQPTLPEWKTAALGAVRLGVADKIFLEFEIDPELEAQQLQQTAQQEAAVQVQAGPHTGPQSAPVQPLQQGQQQQQGIDPGSPAVVQGGQPEPWNMGRKPSIHAQLHAAGCASNGDVDSGTGDYDNASASLLSVDTNADNAGAALRAGVLSVAESSGVSTLAPHARPHTPPPSWNAQQPMLHVPEATAALSALMVHSAPTTLNGATLQALQGSALAASSRPASTAAEHTASSCSGAAAQLAMAAHPSAQQHGQSGQQQGQHAQRRARRQGRHRKSVHSYAFLWPLDQPLDMGQLGAARAMQSLPAGLPPPPVPRPIADSVPRWCLGLHSIRFNPGPEWVQPSELAKAVQPRVSPQGQAKMASAVLWITGEAAMEMESLSDAEVQAGVVGLLRAFPQVPLPPGAKLPPSIVRTRWGTDDLFRGSYSYLNASAGDHAGSAVDLLAEPLRSTAGIPVVMFAGEATHRHYMGTVHGAFASGIREAERFRDAVDQLEAQAAWHMGRAAAQGASTLGGSANAATASTATELQMYPSSDGAMAEAMAV